MKKNLFGGFLVFICLMFILTISFAAASVPVTNITLSADSITINVGKTVNVKATLEPKNATAKKLTWSSSDESIATVSNGKIKGVTVGEATITAAATDESGITATIKVSVQQPVKKIVLTEKTSNMAIGVTHKLSATVEPANATNPGLEWSSSNEKVATVDENGVVTAISKGSAKITAKAADGSKIKAVTTVKVKKYDLVFLDSKPQQITYHMSGMGHMKIRGSVKNNNVSIPDIKTDMFFIGSGSEKVAVTPLHPGTDVVTIKINSKKLKYTVYIAEDFNKEDI